MLIHFGEHHSKPSRLTRVKGWNMLEFVLLGIQILTLGLWTLDLGFLYFGIWILHDFTLWVLY